MADLPSHPDSNDDTGVGPDRGSTTSTRWGRYVLLGIIGLVLLFVVLHLTGGGLGVESIEHCSALLLRVADPGLEIRGQR